MQSTYNQVFLGNISILFLFSRSFSSPLVDSGFEMKWRPVSFAAYSIGRWKSERVQDIVNATWAFMRNDLWSGCAAFAGSFNEALYPKVDLIPRKGVRQVFLLVKCFSTFNVVTETRLWIPRTFQLPVIPPWHESRALQQTIPKNSRDKNNPFNSRAFSKLSFHQMYLSLFKLRRLQES